MSATKHEPMHLFNLLSNSIKILELQTRILEQ